MPWIFLYKVLVTVEFGEVWELRGGVFWCSCVPSDLASTASFCTGSEDVLCIMYYLWGRIILNKLSTCLSPKSLYKKFGRWAKRLLSSEIYICIHVLFIITLKKSHFGHLMPALWLYKWQMTTNIAATHPLMISQFPWGLTFRHRCLCWFPEHDWVPFQKQSGEIHF